MHVPYTETCRENWLARLHFAALSRDPIVPFSDGIAIGGDQRYPLISMFRPEPPCLKASEGTMAG